MPQFVQMDEGVMPSVYEDVLEWARGRPWWQQQCLARIARGEAIGPADSEEIAQSLTRPAPPEPDGGWLVGLAAPVVQSETVCLAAIRGVSNVNRLAESQELTFSADGLTVVFGNNGSGKSGYARVIQSMVRTRHRANILTDVFAEAPGSQSAEIVYTVDGVEASAALGEPAPVVLARVAFYDEQCGNTYLDAEAEISYRPSALQLLDDLTAACNGVRSALDRRRRESSTSLDLPQVSRDGPSATFLATLSARTTDGQIAAATACPSDAESTLQKQVNEVARLRSADPARERQRLDESASAVQSLADHLRTLEATLGADTEDQLKRLVEDSETADRAADVASRVSFADEPLPHVGSKVWQSLWRAAEAYSAAAYPEGEFPNVDAGDRCVLCQQPLADDAQSRLMRFHHFVTDTTIQQTRDTRRALDEFKATIGRVSVSPQVMANAVARAEQEHEGFAESFQPFLDSMEERRSQLSAGSRPRKPVSIAKEAARLDQWAKDLRTRAAGVDAQSFADRVGQAEAEERRLRDQIAMRAGRASIEAERERLRTIDRLNDLYSAANTRSITDKVGELTRTYVSEEARDRFARETDRLGLERVTFRATRARQGVLLHKTDFVNARAGTRLADVLSEGEQTALGFAGFLTEAYFEPSKSTLVFDDPVCSLDHLKREAVANRIVALGDERQVIVFTHDVAFTAELRKAAAQSGVPFATRGVERRRKVGPGFTTVHHPWTAQDAATRIDTLRRDVAALRREEEGMTDTEYLEATESIAGHMSETWERVISQVVAEPLVDYKALEVRVNKLRVVGRIATDDVKAYDDSYTRISGWASRHDRHPELNYSPPTVQLLQHEIEVLHAWLKKIKGYQKP